MRDGIFAARAGVPAVSIVTELFAKQGEFVARSVGMPDIPRVIVPHPCSGTGLANLQRVADELAPRIINLLAGRNP